MNHQEKLSAGFIIARRKAPYFDAALTGLIRCEVPDLHLKSDIVGMKPTMGVTDQGVLMYQREAIDEWSVDEIAAVLIHEIGHLLRAHAERCKSFGGHRAIYNIASDAEINDDIIQGGWKLPGEPITPSRLGAKDGLTAEEYYALVESKVTWVDCPCTCGSGSGNPFQGEPKIQGRTEVEIKIIRHRCAEAISKRPGTVPGGWVVWAKEQLTPPKIRWQEKLARATRHAVQSRPGATIHSWKRLSRRQAACGFGPGRPILPSYVQPRPEVSIAIDTSGSMSQKELAVALREAWGILRTVGASVTFVACDAVVHSLKNVRTVEDIVPLLKGGGGTDFRPVFAELQKSRKPPEVLIFATDGCGPAPATEPPWCKTIWLLIGEQLEHPCSWGEQIEVRT